MPLSTGSTNFWALFRTPALCGSVSIALFRAPLRLPPDTAIAITPAVSLLLGLHCAAVTHSPLNAHNLLPADRVRPSLARRRIGRLSRSTIPRTATSSLPARYIPIETGDCRPRASIPTLANMPSSTTKHAEPRREPWLLGRQEGDPDNFSPSKKGAAPRPRQAMPTRRHRFDIPYRQEPWKPNPERNRQEGRGPGRPPRLAGARGLRAAPAGILRLPFARSEGRQGQRLDHPADRESTHDRWSFWPTIAGVT